jgi:hypothetical protein
MTEFYRNLWTGLYISVDQEEKYKPFEAEAHINYI